MKDIEPCGLYIISDQYFLDFPNERYMDNKKESRPHYYAIRDNDGIFWMIPLSSKVEKCRVKIEKNGKSAWRRQLYFVLRCPDTWIG